VAQAQILEAWQSSGDPKLWKLIVSPEFGDRVDLKALTRDLITRMEKDLGTRLEWVAVTHFNTEHPHVHVALRGIRDDKSDLNLTREYVRQGIRAIAENLCTRLARLFIVGCRGAEALPPAAALRYPVGQL